uniref:Uncharacterized protein n=1 Tax=viral metagenome TaxID=1070528 RepID=A0A6M3LRP3_9ZZZZ
MNKLERTKTDPNTGSRVNLYSDMEVAQAEVIRARIISDIDALWIKANKNNPAWPRMESARAKVEGHNHVQYWLGMDWANGQDALRANY